MIIKLFSLIKLDLKKSKIEYKLDKDITILDMIQYLDSQYDGYFSKKLIENDTTIKTGTIILVNGKNILHIDGLSSIVSNNDVLSVFPPSAGG